VAHFNCIVPAEANDEKPSTIDHDSLRLTRIHLEPAGQGHDRSAPQGREALVAVTDHQHVKEHTNPHPAETVFFLTHSLPDGQS